MAFLAIAAVAPSACTDDGAASDTDTSGADGAMDGVDDTTGDTGGTGLHLSPADVQSALADATAALGLDAVGPVEQCLAVADLDGDALEDLLFWRDGGPVIFRRTDAGGFALASITVTGAVEPAPFLRALTCAAADLDGDGRTDIVASGIGTNVAVLWGTGPSTWEQTVLPLEGDTLEGDAPVAMETGVEFFTPGIVLTDVDRDGLVDLFVLRSAVASLATRVEPVSRFVGFGGVSECCVSSEGDTWYCCGPWCDPETGSGPDAPAPGPRNHLFRQAAGRVFSDASADAGANQPWLTWAATVTDANEDTIPDLFLANDFGPNSVLLGDGDGGFEAVPPREAGMVLFDNAMGVTTADIDGDGHMDAALTEIGLPMFVLGNGDGSFDEAYPADGLGELPGKPLSWGLTFVDLDLDGDADLFVSAQYLGPNLDCWASAGSGIYNGLADSVREEVLEAQANLVYLNTGGRFEVGLQAPPVGDYRGTQVVVPVDVDGDFDEDVVALEFRVGDKDRMHVRVWENTFEGNGRARIRVVDASGYAAVAGTRIEVEAGGVRQTFVTSNAVGYSAQRGQHLIVGLGDAEEATVRVGRPGQPLGEARTLRPGDDVTLEALE